MENIDLNQFEGYNLEQSISKIRYDIEAKTLSENKLKAEIDKQKIQKEYSKLLSKNKITLIAIVFTIAIALIMTLISKKDNLKTLVLNFSESDFVLGNELKVIQAYQYSKNNGDYDLYKKVVGNYGVIEKFNSEDTHYEISSSIKSIRTFDNLQFIVTDNNDNVHYLINLKNRLYYREDFIIR